MAQRLIANDQQPKRRRSIPLLQLSEKPRINFYQASRDGREDVVQKWLDRESERRRKFVVDKADREGFTALHYAARFNRYGTMQRLVEHYDADINVKTKREGITPLHFAAKYLSTCQRDDSAQPEAIDSPEDGVTSSLRAVQLLVNKPHCAVNVQDNNGLTPLHVACSRGNREAVDTLLQCEEIKVDVSDSRMHTPLHEACLLGDAWIVEKLLQKDAPLLRGNDDGLMPLHLACQGGHANVAQLIIQDGKRRSIPLRTLIDATGYKRNTPLHLACDSGATEIVEMLVQQGATTSLLNITGLSPMHIAARQGFRDIAEILVQYDPNNIGILDQKQQTPLHHAAKHDRVEVMKFLRSGADMDAVDQDSCTPLLLAATFGRTAAFQDLMESQASLYAADKDRKSCVFLAAEHNHIDILRVLIHHEKGAKLCGGTDTKLNTPLHIAAMKGNLGAMKVLFDAHIRLDARNEDGKMPLHLAAENGHIDIVKALLEYEKNLEQKHDRFSIIDDGDGDLNTPLHLACSHGHYHVTKYFLDLYADPNSRNSRLLTPLHYAAKGGWDRIQVLLIDAEAEIDPFNDNRVTPLHLACEKDHLKSVEMLICHGADVTIRNAKGHNCLDVAIENGQDGAALAIVKSDQWEAALRNLTEGDNTPMRKLIRKMPTVARAVLNRCLHVDRSIPPDNPEFAINIKCEFLEDFSYPKHGLIAELSEIQSELQSGLHNISSRISKSLTDLTAPTEDTPRDKQAEEDGVPKTPSKYWATDWGPPKFRKSNHPLAIMVESQQTDLLKHPVVTTLLDYKWRRYTQIAYFFNLFIYMLYVFLLTAFALSVYSREEQICRDVFSDTGNVTNVNQTNVTQSVHVCAEEQRSIYAPYHFRGDNSAYSNYKSAAEFWFLFVAAFIIVILALTRLIMEMFQLLLRRLSYISDWINWLENILFGCSVAFVWVFQTDCYCERNWQWQVGVVAVFLAWINLVIFAEKIPLTGLYVVMFLNIFYTFMRMVILAFLLVVSFALAFYMLFYDPDDKNITAFDSPARSLFKTMTMTTGELDFDSLFRQDGEHGEDVAYLPASVILWVFFIVLMPILLTNLLVGLAVGDIAEVHEAATLKRLALKVELALSVEERMPSKMRQRLVIGEVNTLPNRRLNPCEWLLYIFWGGSGYDAQQIVDIAHEEQEDAVEEIQEQTEQLANDIDDLKRTMGERFAGLEHTLFQIARKLDIPVDK